MPRYYSKFWLSKLGDTTGYTVLTILDIFDSWTFLESEYYSNILAQIFSNYLMGKSLKFYETGTKIGQYSVSKEEIQNRPGKILKYRDIQSYFGLLGLNKEEKCCNSSYHITNYCSRK